VTGLAAAREIVVRRARLRRVAARAPLNLQASAVSVVARTTRRVARRRARALLAVAARARLLLSAGVRIVATLAARVPRVSDAALGGVTRGARHGVGARVVRQALMAARAARVSRPELSDTLRLGRVATRAQARALFGQLEAVRDVAARAGQAFGVKRMFARCAVMAGGALRRGRRRGARVRARRVRCVARRAAGVAGSRGVIARERAVTTGAGSGRVCAYVVWAMAAHALVVRRNALGGEGVLLLVAALALGGVRSREVVRLMTARAALVSRRGQGLRVDRRVSARVTRNAAFQPL
jgi:hypothetical protein